MSCIGYLYCFSIAKWAVGVSLRYGDIEKKKTKKELRFVQRLEQTQISIFYFLPTKVRQLIVHLYPIKGGQTQWLWESFSFAYTSCWH